MSLLARTLFTNEDIALLSRVVLSEDTDKRTAESALADDDDILEGVLSSDKLRTLLDNDADSILHLSPAVFFYAQLLRVRDDMSRRPYTVETQERHAMYVFDGGEVESLLDERPIRVYLVHMLLSFLKITSFSVPIRVRSGVWRKIRFSDFDIDSLIQYSGIVDEDARFPSYKRVADICLFMVGLFPEHLGMANPFELPGGRPVRHMSRRSFEDLVELGKIYYRQAADHKSAERSGLSETLSQIAAGFRQVAKPLTVMEQRYLRGSAGRLFLQ